MKHFMILAAFLAGGAQAGEAATGACVQAAGAGVGSGSEQCWRSSAAARRAEVRFAFDSAELSAEARWQLDELARGLAEAGEIVATAHADRLGGEEHNVALSARRADAVRAYLEERGVPLGRVRVEARGASEPLAGLRCAGLGEESGRNAKLVACLAPERRVEVRSDGD